MIRKHLTRLPRLRCRAFAAGITLPFLALSTVSSADDTEIYFGQVTTTEESSAHSPNILFLLDTSGSMGWLDSGQVGNRMERLQSAMDLLLSELTDVNVGVMTMNGTLGGGPIRYPVTPLDATSCGENEECEDVLVFSRVNDAADDTEQRTSTGAIDVDASTLAVRGTGNASADRQTVGVRFTDLDIPQGALITGAYLDMTASEGDNGAAQWTIRGDDTDSAAPLSTDAYDLSNRSSTAATVTYDPGTWTEGQQYSSSDLKNVVQEIVDRNGWCGGNDLALIIEGSDTRRIVSKEAADANAANGIVTPAMSLRVTYDGGVIPAGQGCRLATAFGKIPNVQSDAYEYASGYVRNNSTYFLMGQIYGSDLLGGLRFSNVDIPQGAPIVDAEIRFGSGGRQTGDNVNVTITGHDVDDSWSVGTSARDLSDRVRTASSVDWSMVDNAATYERVTSVDIAPIVQEIVDRPGWSPDNTMMMLIDQNGSQGTFALFFGFQSSPDLQPTIKITYKSYSDGSKQTNRDELKRVTDQLVSYGGTPLLSQQYEAAQYFLGNEMVRGRSRGRQYKSSTYRVSHPDSYTGGELYMPPGCDTNDPFDSDCLSEAIVDGPGGDVPTYISPIEGSCQTHHIVILSDGVASTDFADDEIRPLIGATTCDNNNHYAEACGTDLQRWLYETDHDTSMDGFQNIRTHTVAFNLAHGAERYLKELATAGGGEFHSAESANDLVSAFNSIVAGALSGNSSFGGLAATVSQYNRLAHRNDVYLALFSPETTPDWSGNLKRYTLDTYTDTSGAASTELLDANGSPAVNPETGYFDDTALSLWDHIDNDGNVTTTPDGHTVPGGGVASRIGVNGIENRNMYTFVGNIEADIPAAGVDLADGGHSFHESNANITAELLGLVDTTLTNAERAEYRLDLLRWARGVDVNDEDGDGNVTEPRRAIGDALHSTPVVVNYDNGDSIDARSIIYVSTNDGVLHAFDTETGNELWAFTPQELLGTHNVRFKNLASTPHPYGLDGGLTLWRDDPDNNRIVDHGESVYLYVGMRRGGDSYYAFDITNADRPKLAWAINGEQNGGTDPKFAELGQSWSQPAHARIMDGSNTRDVLVFGAGYDVNQDADPGRDQNGNTVTMNHDPDTVGRGLFIVDAQTGENLWTVSGPDIGLGATADQRFSDMEYSIPANVRIVDIDFDGFMDQLYVADTGGQLWRFDVTGTIDDMLLSGGVIADISVSEDSGHRRFYATPDVALIQKGGQSYLAISIGSGWRAHPLNDVIKDAQYVIHMPLVRGAPEGYGLESTSGNYRPITEDDLMWVNSPSTSYSDADLTHGWYYRFTEPGEKALGTSVIFQDVMYFATYVPEEHVSDCAAGIGSGFVYALSIADGTPAIDFDNDGILESDWNSGDSTLNAADDARYELKQGGIPAKPTLYFPEGAKPTMYVGTENIPAEFTIGTSRTYWVDTGVIKDTGLY